MRLEYQIAAAFCLDLVLGDPRWFPHPVCGIARFAVFLEGVTRRIMHPRTAGVLTALTVILTASSVVAATVFLAGLVHPVVSDIVSILILYTTFAANDLAHHSRRVLDALEQNSLAAARVFVSWMVGRDTRQLDEQGAIRATVESVAENTVDGVVAPLFWAAIAGPAGAVAYKAVSTLDSTFGYKNEHYREFGWASARIDDAANFLPARLSVMIIAFAAWLTKLSSAEEWRIARRDGRKHASPNSGWPEAAFAGALGVRLGGTVMRGGQPVHLPYIGDSQTPLVRRHIRQANRLMLATAVVAALGFIAVRHLTGGCL